MLSPRGVVYPMADAPPGRLNLLTRPLASVSCSAPPRPVTTWNRARRPSGDQATSCGADRQLGQLASWYLVPAGLIR